jgi:superfamily I DNA/RNA helicase
MNFSDYQQAIFDFVEHGTGNAIIEAVAGAGKTTTIVEAMKRTSGSAIFLAFNKAIAEELKRRGVNARTFHSLTYGPVLNYVGARTVTQSKLRDIIDENLSEQGARMYGPFLVRLVGLGRQAGIGCLIDDTEQNWSDLADHHDLELDSESASRATALRYASRLLEASSLDARVDFDDMLYLAVRHGITLPKFDWVFVDEVQDTNAIQRALLRKITHEGSRVVAVGDPAQAIYGFRGADSDSMATLAAEFSMQALPLHVSYRCPKLVIEEAQRWVPHIQALETASDGKVETLDAWTPEVFKAEDLVVCRTTRPLISLAYGLLKARVPARIMGKEIGTGLARLITNLYSKGIDNLIERIGIYTRREVEKAVAKKNEAKAESIQDRTDAILFLIDSLKETNRTVPALLALIDELFSDVKNAVVLATIHKAKGLEAKRVFWLNSSQCPARWARQEWQQQQERNLCYVAVTRAREELYLIEESR